MSDSETIAKLSRKIEELEHRLAIHDDIHAVRTLQHKYGYYMDKCLFNEVVDLFAEDGELRAAGRLWRGKASLKRIYVDRIGGLYSMQPSGPPDGLIADHMQLQDIVDIAPDRKTAKARFRYFMPGGWHMSSGGNSPGMGQQWWEAGLYENEYVREGGIWKIAILGLYGMFRADYQTGWRYAMAMDRKPVLYPEDPGGPDELYESPVPPWPKAGVLPFHYPHPVTGKMWESKK